MSGATIRESENAARIKRAEGLDSAQALLDFLISQYDSFPEGYAGGYSQLRLDYPAHLDHAATAARAHRVSFSAFIADTHPNTFMTRRDVPNIADQRRAAGSYATDRLAPITRAYEHTAESIALERVKRLGRPSAFLARSAGWSELWNDLAELSVTTDEITIDDLRGLRPEPRKVLSDLDRA